MVRWKLGILKFTGDQYLTGLAVTTAEEAEPPPELAQIRRDAELLGISEALVRLHSTLVKTLDKGGRLSEAAENFEVVRSLAGRPPQAP
jgi:hypothetical protein